MFLIKLKEFTFPLVEVFLKSFFQLHTAKQERIFHCAAEVTTDQNLLEPFYFIKALSICPFISPNAMIKNCWEVLTT